MHSDGSINRLKKFNRLKILTINRLINR